MDIEHALGQSRGRGASAYPGRNSLEAMIAVFVQQPANPQCQPDRSGLPGRNSGAGLGGDPVFDAPVGEFAACLDRVRQPHAAVDVKSPQLLPVEKLVLARNLRLHRRCHHQGSRRFHQWRARLRQRSRLFRRHTCFTLWSRQRSSRL